MLSRITTILAGNSQGIEHARTLFREYEAELGVDLCFQSFEEELATLPGKYEFPKGRLLIAYDEEDQPLGCAAFRPIEEGVCEMKRLYVKPEARRMQIGIKLVRYLLYDAEAEGYRRMRLDTLRRLDPAVTLYRSFGFEEIEPYYENPEEDVVFMERSLTP